MQQIRNSRRKSRNGKLYACGTDVTRRQPRPQAYSYWCATVSLWPVVGMFMLQACRQKSNQDLGGNVRCSSICCGFNSWNGRSGSRSVMNAPMGVSQSIFCIPLGVFPSMRCRLGGVIMSLRKPFLLVTVVPDNWKTSAATGGRDSCTGNETLA